VNRAAAPSLVLALSLLGAAEARAGNFDGAFAGDQASLSGGAVSATIAGAESVWINPAGLSRVEGNRIDVSGTIARVSFTHLEDALSLDAGPGQRFDEDLDSTDFTTIASAVAFARRLDPDFSMGLGLFTPESFEINQTQDLAATVMDPSSRALLVTQSGSFHGVREDFAAGGGAGLRLSPRVRLGAALFGTYRDMTNDAQVFVSNRDVETDANQLSVLGVQRSEFSGAGLMAVLGAQADVTDDLTLGLSLRSPEVLLWRTERTRDSTSVAVGSGGASNGATGDTQDQHIQAAQASAARIVAAGAVKLGAARISAELEVLPPFTSSAAGVEGDLTCNGRIGLLVPLGESVTLGAGLFTDLSPQSAPDQFTQVSIDYYGVTLGLEYATRLTLAKEEGAEASRAVEFRTVLALRYAYGEGEGQGFEYAPFEPDSLRSTRVDVVAHELSVYIGGGVSF